MSSLKYTFLDSLTMFKRCMSLSLRNTDVLITSLLLPVMMMILFVYVFGGALNIGEVDYVNYVVPGVIVLTVGYCASVTAVSVCSDMTKGIVDRFRSMPISNSSVLTGHVLASIVRNSFATAVVIAVAILIGFRPVAGIMEWFVAIGILLLYMLVITWFSVFFGLVTKTPDGAGTFGFFILMLPYLSSGFVPTETMPSVLRVFSENQPLTPIIESLRSLFIDSESDINLSLAILWCIGLLIIAYLASILMYEQKAKE